MGLVDTAKRDTLMINTDLNGWGVIQNWTHPVAGQLLTITGRHVKHHLTFDEFGNSVNSKKASCTFSEQSMINGLYNIRNASGEVTMKGHLVQIKDSTGNFYKYKVKEFFPDEVLGQIVCILEAYE